MPSAPPDLLPEEIALGQNPPAPARRLAVIPPSGTMEVGRKVRELRDAGVDVIHLGAGSPTPSPDILNQPVMLDAARNTLGDPAGMAELRVAIADKLAREQSVPWDAATEVVVTVGAKQGLYAALLALLEPEDEVAILDPAWVTYEPAIQLAGGVPRTFALDRANANRLDVTALEAATGPRTKAVIINTPHNPTGRVFTRVELQAVADFAIARNLWIICDESFDKFVFDGRQHVSIASLAGMKQRTIVLQSFSKAYGFIGGRIGYLAGPPEIAALVKRFNEHVLSCVSPFLQTVALAALSEEPAWSEQLRSEYQKKRDLVVAAVEDIPGLTCAYPEGTFYVWADISGLNRSSSVAFASELLEGARVAVTPGSAFGPSGENFIRFNLAGPVGPIQEGLQRIASYLAQGGNRA